MSRSYKKHPSVSTIAYNGSKRRANRQVRRCLKDREVALCHADFKKVYCSWDIHDFKEVAPSFEAFYRDMVNRWYNDTLSHRLKKFFKNAPPTRMDCLKIYRHWYVRK